jgi:hypothetical protein
LLALLVGERCCFFDDLLNAHAAESTPPMPDGKRVNQSRVAAIK